MVSSQDCRTTTVKIAWNTNRTFARAVYVITCLLLLPVFIIVKVCLDFIHLNTERGGEGGGEGAGDGGDVDGGRMLLHWFLNFFSFPYNRLLARAISQIIFLFIVLFDIYLEHYEDNIYLKGVIIYSCIGFLVDDLARFFRRSYFRQSFYRKLDVLSFIVHLILLTGLIMTVYDHQKRKCSLEEAWVNHTVRQDCRCPLKTLDAKDAYPLECEIGASLHGFGNLHKKYRANWPAHVSRHDVDHAHSLLLGPAVAKHGSSRGHDEKAIIAGYSSFHYRVHYFLFRFHPGTWTPIARRVLAEALGG